MHDSPTQPASLALMYHRMGSPLRRSLVRGQYVTAGCLRSHLRTLAALGYRPTTLAEARRAPGCFALTFDDGYASVGEVAWPILQAAGVTCTMFVVVDAIGGTNAWDVARGDCVERLADAAALRALAAAGMEIGCHTLTHARLPECSEAQLRAEIVDAKHRLEDLLGRAVPGFSYPYGAWDPRVRDAVIAAGYAYATATQLGPLTPDVDPFTLPRLNVRWNTVGWLMRRKVARAYREGAR